MESARKSSFTGLVKYLTNSQNKLERVGAIEISHCHSSEIEWALQEVEATQSQNQRAQGDKVYHMLIAFPPGEAPSSSVLQAIEERVCAAMGFSEHQRIRVVHHDTDNLHLHI